MFIYSLNITLIFFLTGFYNLWDFSLSFFSVWVMMNKQTRKLSKMPDEVREEIEPYFVDAAPIIDDDSTKLPKLAVDAADYVREGLTVSYLL